MFFKTFPDDKKCKTKAYDHDYKGYYSLDNLLSDAVKHDAESATQKWISSDHKNYLDPGQTNRSRGHNVEDILNDSRANYIISFTFSYQIFHEEHCCQRQRQNTQFEPTFKFPKVSSANRQIFPELL